MPAAVPTAAEARGCRSCDSRADDGEELRELVVEAWRRTAPKRVVAAFDRG